MPLPIISHALNFSTLKFQVLWALDCTSTPLGFMWPQLIHRKTKLLTREYKTQVFMPFVIKLLPMQAVRDFYHNDKDLENISARQA